MNTLSPLIWVWPTAPIRKVLFSGSVLPRALRFRVYPCPAFSRLFTLRPVSLSLSPPPPPCPPPHTPPSPRQVWQAELNVGCSPDYKNHSSVPQTVQSGSNKESFPIDPIHKESHSRVPPLEGSVAQAELVERVQVPFCSQWETV